MRLDGLHATALSLGVTLMAPFLPAPCGRPTVAPPPVQVEFVCQHPPVVAPGLGGIQAAAQLLADRERNAEGAGADQRGDVAGRVHQ